MSTQALPTLYRRAVLQRPVLIILLLVLIAAFFTYHARHFQLDASADSLLLESDKDLLTFRDAQQRYRTQDLLVVTYSPDQDLFADDALTALQALRDELGQIESVETVFSLFEAPLLTSSGIVLSELSESVPTLETHPEIDRKLIKEELSTSPVFGELLLSTDGQTTALLLTLNDDLPLQQVAAQRSELRLAKLQGTLNEDQQTDLKQVDQEYELLREQFNKRRHDDIASIRSILERYRNGTELHLGGVPMVADDMISYIGRDLVTFGVGVLLFIVAILAFIFRRVRWVALPIASCAFSGLVMIGLLGLVGWKVTVISSNFISLMLILTMSMNMHLIVRYRQLALNQPEGDHVDQVWFSMRRMFWPCLYTALTTIIGFSSLVFSGIKPVIDFGWMMSIGLVVTFLTSFLLFPALLVWLGPLSHDATADKPVAATRLLAGFTQRFGILVLLAAAVIGALSFVGITRLQVENSFINYFRDHTEIYQGMKLIDERLGGTTPLDVLLDLTEQEDEECADLTQLDEEDQEYCEELEMIKEESEPADYWFTPFKIDRIKAVHDYLDAVPEVGKVLSLASILRAGETINEGKEFTPFELAILYKKIPADIREQVIEPYISIDNDEARVSIRIRDSLPDLRRKELLERISADLQKEVGVPAEKSVISGVLVLYNNMLQSLFQSQIQTIGAVLLGIAIMFLVLFRSVSLAIIGIIPNALAAAFVLGIMGLAKIPLDMMTITIATITIGIAVDNSIHYIYRFREEFAKNPDYNATMNLCHANIGRAVLYTSVTIIFGFSILVFSNFIPTILFGVLTATAMAVALLAVLTLLPKLITLFKPFGPEAA